MLVMTGRADHSGATPMHGRADALAAAAETMVAIEALARGPQHHGVRATVGLLDVEPNSITTIPGRVSFSVDVRDVDHERQRRTSVAIAALARGICDRRGIQLTQTPLSDTAPAVLPVWVRGLAIEACEKLDAAYRVITSGASHDAQVINTVVPAGIIFVPSRDGVSHAPAEWTSSADIARGVDVMLETLLLVDRTMP